MLEHIIIIHEVLLALQRVWYRKHYFKLAKQRSIDLGKPLMVIGNPDSAYGNSILDDLMVMETSRWI